jgi:hypothetical protein
MASYRLRTEIPAKHLGASINDGEADVVVFSKPVKADIDVARQCKGNAAVVVDICDPHDYSEILRYADRIVVSSEALLELHPTATVIPDPIEGPGGAPHADAEMIAWIGHRSNLRALDDWLRKLRVPVVVCTNDTPDTLPWSLEMQAWVYEAAGKVLVPATTRFKSANRVAQAIHEGCFVVASDIPAYRPLRQWAWVGSYPTGMRWASSRVDLNDIVADGQRHVREHFAPERICEQWRDFLGSI